MPFSKLIIPAVIACLCNTIANTLWKLQFTKKPLSIASFSDAFNTVFTVNIIGGICFYIGSMLLFFYLLSNFKLSVIMPVMCLTYVFNIIIAAVVFKEQIVPIQAVGTSVILVGLILLSRA